MHLKKQLILIPFWVPEVLNRNQLSISECLNFPKIKPLLALNDLVGFASLQDSASRLTGVEEGSLGSLFSAWSTSIPKDQPDVYEYMSKTVWTVSEDPTMRKELEARLFAEDSKTDRYKVPFIIYDLTPEFSGVVIHPGFFVQAGDDSLQISLVEAMLKALYVYETYNEVAKTALFQRYLELLRKQTAIV